MRRHIKLYWSNEYIQGGIFLMLSSFIVNALNYLFNFFAARKLGPMGYGELIVFYSYIALLSVPLTVISSIIIQRISSHPVNPYAYARSFAVQFRQIILRFSPFILLSLLVIPFISRITNLSPVVSYLLIPTILMGLMTSFYSSLFQGLKLFFLFSLLSVAGVVLKLASIFIPVFNYGALNEILIFQFIAGVFILWLSFAILSHLLHTHVTEQSAPVFATLRRLVVGRQFTVTLFSVLSFTMLSSIDIIFVKKFFLPGIVGIYSSWSLFAKIILYVVGPIAQISFVFFAGNTRKLLQDRILLTTLGVLALVGIIGYIGYSSLGDVLISGLFGEKFLGVTPYLGLAGIYGAFYAAISFLNTYFLAKKSRFALILIILLPFYFITLFLIPRNLSYLMWTNIIFAGMVAVSYLGAFFLSTK